MTAVGSWPVAVLCASCGFALWQSAAHAEEVARLINEAHSRYEQSIEQIEQEAITRLDELIERYSDEGNLQKVLELRSQRTKLLEDRAWPESTLFRTMREKIRSSRLRAKRELANAYEDAIANLTKERRYDDAVALRKELDELTEIQATFDFRSEEPGKKKSPEDDEPNPADKPKPQNSAKATAATPPKPKPGASNLNPIDFAGAAANGDLAGAFSAAEANTPFDSVTATSRERREILSTIVRDFYRQWPPRVWTAQQFEDFVEFFATASAKADRSACSLPGVSLDASTGGGVADSLSGRSSGHDTREFALVHPAFQWLMSSPTPEEFVSRVRYLRAKNHWLRISAAVSVEDLKLWLRSVGCTDAEEVKTLLDGFVQAKVTLGAVTALRAEFRE